MKKGKSVKLNLYTPIKTVYGTVDSKNLKSVYINIQSWVTPKEEYDNWNRVVSNLGREIKHSVFNSINTNNSSIFYTGTLLQNNTTTIANMPFYASRNSDILLRANLSEPNPYIYYGMTSDNYNYGIIGYEARAGTGFVTGKTIIGSSKLRVFL